MNRYEALKHAVNAHAGQVDKCGQPYILHPIAVAEAIDSGPVPGGRGKFAMWWAYGGGQEDASIVALLHDVWEDTDYDLTDVGLSPFQLRQLMLLTRLSGANGAPYTSYIRNVCEEPVACIVKLADLWHNLSPQRQDCLPAAEAKSLQGRYLKAREQIWEALGYRWWPDGGEGSK